MLHTTKLLSSARFSRVASNCLSLAFLLFLFALFSPVTPELSSAAPTSAVSDQAAVEFSASVIPAVSVAVESSVNLDVAPSSTGSFATTPTTVTVSTNSREGYSLFLEASGETNALLPQLNKDNPATIASLDTNTTEANFPVNHWGVNLSGSSDYQPVPIDATDAIVSSSTANAADTYTLNFAVKIDDTLPVDTYSGSVLLSAVANPVAARNLAELVYMQNMTHEICENTADYVDVDHYVTKQLIDTRDGKSYWVAKLADGNCWMVQNLGLDITEEGFTAADTDIESNDYNENGVWGKSSASPPVATDKMLVAHTSNNVTTYSYDLGKLVIAAPTTSFEYCFNAASLSDCHSGIIDVSDESKWQPTYHASNQVWTVNGETAEQLTAVKYNNPDNPDAGGEYDAHYLLGNYYQWNTATAGTGRANTFASGIVNSSICPRGWKLPLAGETYNNTSGSFYYLFNRYGVTSKIGGATNRDDNAAGYNALKDPLYFSLPGFVGIVAGRLSRVGINSAYSSSVPYTDSNRVYYSSVGGYAEDIYTKVSPTTFDQRSTGGFSVRCLAR